MEQQVRILLVEDKPDDAELVILALRHGRLNPTWERVETADELRTALANGPWDAVLSDYTLPAFGAEACLEVVRDSEPDLPFIVVSGTVGEDVAVRIMRAGANDYVLKQALTRLAPAVVREMREAENRRVGKQADQAMRASETRFRRLFEAAQDGILIVDLTSRQILDANPFLADLIGFTREELVGKELWEIGLFGDIEANKAGFRTLQEVGYIRYDDLPLLTRDGRHIAVEFVSNVYEVGGTWVIQCNIRDVTEKKRVEEELRLFRTLIDHTSDGVEVIDPETGRFLDVNERTCIAHGYTRDELLGMGVPDLDPQAASQPWEALIEEGRFEGPRLFESRHRRKDGSTFPVEVAHSSIFLDREYLVAVVRDITDRKREEEALRASEERLRSLVENVSAPVAMFDREMRYLHVSRRWTTDYRLGERNITGLSHYDVFPDLPQSWKDIHQRCLAGAIDRCDEASLKRADGTLQWIRWDVRPWLASGGEFGGIIMFTEDITDRKASGDILRASEERYRTLIAATSAIVWDSPASGAFDSDQPAWTAFTGQTLEQHRGWGWLDAIHPDDQELSAQAWAAATKDRTTYQVEHRLRRADGEYRYMSARAVPILDSDGAVREWVGIHSDITDRKRAEMLLVESQERLTLATESAGIGIWDWDMATNQMEWDARMFSLYGIRDQEFTGAYDVWQNGLHPDDRDRAEAEVAAALAGSKTFHTEFRVVWPEGDVRHIEAHAIVQRKDDGVASRMTGVNRDITDRKQAEEALQLRDRAIRAATQGLMITDSGQVDNPIIYVSPGCERITGYEADEILGRNCRFLQGKDTDPTPVARLREAIQAGKPCMVEMLNYRKDGTSFWNELSISPVRNATGQLTHFVGVQADVTVRRSLEEQFRQAQKMDAFGQLAGGVAHDFNNLLTIINGYSDLLLQTLPVEDPSRELIAEIHKAGERSAGLTRQLLAFSRQQILAPRVLNLNDVVTETDKMLRRLIGEDIRLTTTLDSALWAVQADPGQIEQVLLNLSVNARDAMPKGGRLTIETQNIELDTMYARTHADARVGPHVLLSVTDTGSGMSPRVQTRIFEPFFTTKGPGQGTGLGLATVFGIVKQSGGHITVYSEVGVGTSFKVYLPRIEQRSEVQKAPSRILTPPRGTETILLAEDEAGVRNMTSYILARCGYKILEAADGIEAMRLAEEFTDPIHLLITDVVMPGAGGRAVAEQMVERHPKLRVLFISGYTDDAVIRHGVLREGVHFLQKPFSPAALAFKVRQILDS